MTYDDVVEYIKAAGCRVYIYNQKTSIYGGVNGTFDYNDNGPIICVANKNIPPKKRIETLLHEYGHFLQWQDGFLQYLDGICDGYEVFEKWVNGKEYSAMEIQIARNLVLTIEYDAEKRAIDIGEFLQPDNWSRDYILMGAQSYVTGIKWDFLNRKNTLKLPHRKHFKPKILSNDELFAPLSCKEIRLMELIQQKQKV